MFETTPRIRRMIAAYQEQRGVCLYCKRPITERNATWEHVIPGGWGGPDCDYNLALACEDCNGRKSGLESHIMNQFGRNLDLTSRAALFILRCSKLFRGSKKDPEFRIRYFHMAYNMLRTVDHHMTAAGQDVPRIPKSERGKFL